MPDFEAARRYALERLGRELPPSLLYHNLAHTRDDVAPAAERLASLEGIEGQARLLLLTAAWYHDFGFVVQAAGHEIISAQTAARVLPGLGYSQTQIETIAGIIMATRLPQSPTTHLEQIMADADLDVLGRDDFWRLNQALRAEMEAASEPDGSSESARAESSRSWYRDQLAFMEQHHYFTTSARRLRADGKQRNITALRALLQGQDDPWRSLASKICNHATSQS